VFRHSEAGGLEALYTNANGAQYDIGEEELVQFSQFSIDGFFTRVDRPSIDADEDRAAFAAIFSYVFEDKVAPGTDGPQRAISPPQKGIFIHDAEVVAGQPNLLVVADTLNAHGRFYTRLTDEFDLDGANVFFVSQDPDVQRLEYGDGTNINTVLLSSDPAPGAPQTPLDGGGSFISGGPEHTPGFQTFAYDPCNPGVGDAFRDISAHHFNPGPGPIQTVAFVGRTRDAMSNVGQGVFVVAPGGGPVGAVADTHTLIPASAATRSATSTTWSSSTA
jgi:hypothetical protein